MVDIIPESAFMTKTPPLNGLELVTGLAGGINMNFTTQDIANLSPPGTVTTLSVIVNDGITASVTNPTTTPVINLGLGNITPASVVATGAISGSNLSGTNTGDQTIGLSGDVTGSGTGTFTATIANSVVTYGKIQNIGAASLFGNPTGSSATGSEITLGAGLSFSGSTLTASGSGGTVISVSIATANGISGTVSNPTTTPSLTLALGAITPSSVGATGAVTGSNLSGSNTGDQTITLTGPITGSGTNSFTTNITANAITTTTINAAAVTYAKIQNVNAARLLGNPSASVAATSEIPLGSGLSFVAGALTASGSSGITALTGDVTASGSGSVTATIAANAVTFAKFQQMVANSIPGNATAALANISAITLAVNQLLGRGAGNISAITLGSNLSITSNILNATGLSTALTPTVQVFITSGIYTPSANAKFNWVIAIGGGGSAGGIVAGGASTSAATGGGGSGAVCMGFFAATSQTCTVGAGGAASVGAGNSGAASTFGSLLAGGGGPSAASTGVSTFLSKPGGAVGNPTFGQIQIPGNLGGYGLSFGSSGSPMPGIAGTSPWGYGAGGPGSAALNAAVTSIAGTTGAIIIIEFNFS